MAELSLSDLVDDVELTSVTFFEIRARREDVVDDADGADAEILPTYELQTGHRDDDGGFRARIKTEIVLSLGEIMVEVSAEYALRERKASEISPALMIDFVNNITVMTLVPYIRQAIADVTQRVFGAPLTMPILKRGELSFDAPDSEPQQ